MKLSSASVAVARRSVLASLALTLCPRSSPAADGFSAADQAAYAPSPEMLGGLAPGTGRSLNALIKMRAVTGVTRANPESSPVFKPGQILDNLLSANGGAVTLGFTYPANWNVAGGPNLDVRDLKESDSAFVLATDMPAGKRFEDLKDDFFLDLLFDPAGKYGSYGTVEDRKVVSCSLASVTNPNGAQQSYRRMALKFAPLTYNGNTVERRSVISATEVGGTVFLLAAGSLATRYKKIEPDLLAIQDSFRVLGRRNAGA